MSYWPVSYNIRPLTGLHSGSNYLRQIRFDKGVDGLRTDVAHALFKADGLPDAPSESPVVDGLHSNPLVSDHEEVHEVYRRWRRLAEKYQPHRLLVGEVNLEPARATAVDKPN